MAGAQRFTSQVQTSRTAAELVRCLPNQVQCTVLSPEEAGCWRKPSIAVLHDAICWLLTRFRPTSALFLCCLSLISVVIFDVCLRSEHRASAICWNDVGPHTGCAACMSVAHDSAVFGCLSTSAASLMQVCISELRLSFSNVTGLLSLDKVEIEVRCLLCTLQCHACVSGLDCCR